jgi:putative transposase
MLAAYVGEDVVIRYDPRDMAEIRVYHEGSFLCRAVCQELTGYTVSLKEIVHARNQRRRELKKAIRDRTELVEI